MSTELEIKRLNNVAPVTLAEAVYIGDGTTSTVKDKIEYLLNNSGGSSSSDGYKIIKNGNVGIYVDLNNMKVSWSDGYFYNESSKLTINSGSMTFTTSDCNVWNPNNAYALCYNGSSFEWKTIGSLGSYSGYLILVYHYNDKITSANSHKATIYSLGYPVNKITTNKCKVYGKSTPNIEYLTVLGDSLSSGSNWCKYFNDYIYIPNIDCLAYSGGAMANLSTGSTNIAIGQLPKVSANTTHCVIFAGTNDGMFGGSVNEFVESPTQNNQSFTESYQYTIEKLLTLNPKMKIYLVTPMFTLGKTYGDNAITLESNKQMRDATITVGQWYNLPVLDLFYNSGVNKINSTTYQTDGVHGTELGYKNIYEKIWKFICSN